MAEAFCGRLEKKSEPIGPNSMLLEITDSQTEPIYISPEDSSCIDSDEKSFENTSSTSTLFAQAFRLIAWFFVALILWFKTIWEGMLFPRVPHEGVIWATHPVS